MMAAVVNRRAPSDTNHNIPHHSQMSHWYPFPFVENKPLLEYKFGTDENSRIFSRLLDHMETTILYSLTGHTPVGLLSEPLSGFVTTNPDTTQPVGCLMRFFAYVDNPGSSVCQVELRKSKDKKEYDFYISSAKNGEMLFTGDKFNLEHRVFLLFSIVDRMYQLCPPEQSVYCTHFHFKTFQKETGITTFQPEYWTHFDALIHHVIFKSSHVARKSETLGGWKLSYHSGDFLTVNCADFGSSIRAAVGDFMNGTRHSRLCPSLRCSLCVRHGLAKFCSPDICTTIQSYYIRVIPKIATFQWSVS